MQTDSYTATYSDAFSQTILNNSPDCVKVLDGHGRLMYMNPNGLCLMEIGDFCSVQFQDWWELWPAESRDALKQAVQQALVGHTTTLQAYCPTAKGTPRWWDVVVAPVPNATGPIEQIIATSRDITDRKRAELELREFSQTLEQQVAQRTHELMQANAELKRSNEYLQQFAYVASHDLQEPLRKIQSFGDLLKQAHAPALGDDGLDMLNRMQKSAGRMSELVKALLSYSRLTTRQQPHRPVDLNATLEAVLADTELLLRERGANVSVGELPTVLADDTQMHQLLANLIGNALKFIRPGLSPTVRVGSRMVAGQDVPGGVAGGSTDPPGNARATRYHEISVQDNGIGFAEKHLDRVFGMFHRLHGRGQYEGSGMGLAISKRVVDNHGGLITARSQPGQGATFLVYLPAPDEANA